MGNDEQYFHASVVDNHCGLSAYIDDCVNGKTHAFILRSGFGGPAWV